MPLSNGLADNAITIGQLTNTTYMKILKFKTNIKCDGCVAQVTPLLNGESTIGQWEVDTADADKVLTVSGHEVDPQRVQNLVNQAGFRADLMRVAGVGGGDL